MRLIGHIQGSDPAHLFGDYLYAQGVDNRLDRSGEVTYGKFGFFQRIIWIRPRSSSSSF